VGDGPASVQRLANVAVRDWSDDCTFIMGDHYHRCLSSVVQFLSPRVVKLHSSDATVNEQRLDVEDGDELFDSVLEAARMQLIRLTRKQLQRSAPLYGIQGFIDLFVLNHPTKLQ
jgi:hypothetical protein